MPRRSLAPIPLWVVLGVGLSACGADSDEVPDYVPLGVTHIELEDEDEDTALVLAVIGDYGDSGPNEAAVAELVDSWAPDFILTVGDNNYPWGEASTIDTNIGQYYADYIGDYVGEYGEGSQTNRFWPAPGNHDWYADNLGPYREYFTLPGNERYYAVTLGDTAAVFAIDSVSVEPDGNSADSIQAQLFQQAMEESMACWKIALLHYPPYSSGNHGSSTILRWPFADWGVDFVIAGHDHHYERLEVDGILYFVNGLGGRGRYHLNPPLPESRFAYNQNFGAQRITVSGSQATVAFFDVGGNEIDSVTVDKSCGHGTRPLATGG